MKENYELLSARVLDTLEKSDLERIKSVLKTLKGNTICTGVGGSKVVSDYASHILEAKNNLLSISMEPQEVPHHNLSRFSNVLSCSYSGNNHGVTTSFNNELNKYLLSTGAIPGVNNIQYLSSYPKEHSFISLAATLMPMSILLSYYLDNDYQVIKDILSDVPNFTVEPSSVYEILSSSLRGASEEFLDSTLTESGIAIPLVHGKYGYCHGRTTTSYHNNHSVIHINNDTELDQLIAQELPSYYSQVITLASKYKDPLIDEFYLTYLSMHLAASIANSVNKDVSKVEYSPLVKKLYNFKGGM